MTSFVRPHLVFILLSCLTAGSLARAQIAPVDGVTSVNPTRILQIGVELEKQRKWIEAIQHYETASRCLPEQSEIRRRLLISRLHHDVARRSADTAIREMLTNVSEQDALELYAEVLARLEMSYVEPVNMTEIVRSGTAYFEVALTEPEFVRTHLTRVARRKD